MVNADLRYWFWFYNKKYFKGKLPNYKVKFKKIDDDDLGECFQEDHVIHLANILRWWPNVAKFTLLHEMVHLKLPQSKKPHGKRFQKEMLRLAKAGAFEKLW